MNEMSASISTWAIKSFVAPVAVVSCLAAFAGQSIEAGSTGAGSTPAVSEAARSAQALVTETVLNADASPEVFARAGTARDALGFPAGPARTGRHVQDGLQGSDYDQVAEVDAAGQPIAMTQFDAAGRLVAALRFDSPAGSSRKISANAASNAANLGLTAAGVTVSGQARVDASSTGEGWDVHWDRMQDDVPVRGDETRVHVWQDGRIQSLARVEHPLAPAPMRRLGEAEAQQVVFRQVAKWSVGRDSSYAVGGIDLEWVGPTRPSTRARLGRPLSRTAWRESPT